MILIRGKRRYILFFARSRLFPSLTEPRILSSDTLDPTRAVQPRCTIVFRGKGLRIKKSEKEQWDPRVEVLFQAKAWVDRPTALNIADGAWKKHVESCHTLKTALEDASELVTVERTMMLMDILDAQTHPAFNGALYDLGTRDFFYPGGEIDELAPVDAGYGADVKHETGKQLQSRYGLISRGIWLAGREKVTH